MENIVFVRVAFNEGGHNREPIVIHLQKRSRRNRDVLMEETYFMYPRSEWICPWVRDNIHGFELAPGHQLRNIGKFY